MKFNMSSLSLVVAAALCLPSAGLAFDSPQTGSEKSKTFVAHHSKGKHGHSCHRGGASFFKKLNLNDDQLEKMVDLKTKYMSENVSSKGKLKVKKRELFNLMTKPGTTKDQALALQKEINELRAQLSNARVSFMLDASDLLTDEQRKELRHKMLVRQLAGGHKHGKRWGNKRKKHSRFFSNKLSNEGAKPAVATSVDFTGDSSETFLVMLGDESALEASSTPAE